MSLKAEQSAGSIAVLQRPHLAIVRSLFCASKIPLTLMICDQFKYYWAFTYNGLNWINDKILQWLTCFSWFIDLCQDSNQSVKVMLFSVKLNFH